MDELNDLYPKELIVGGVVTGIKKKDLAGKNSYPREDDHKKE